MGVKAAAAYDRGNGGCLRGQKLHPIRAKVKAADNMGKVGGDGGSGGNGRLRQ